VRLSRRKAGSSPISIRGKSVENALNILQFSPKKAPSSSQGARIGDRECRAQRRRRHRRAQGDADLRRKGPVLKRFMRARKGRGMTHLKPTCHIF
jgi:large subunit ribosomal protein L22